MNVRIEEQCHLQETQLWLATVENEAGSLSQNSTQETLMFDVNIAPCAVTMTIISLQSHMLYVG